MPNSYRFVQQQIVRIRTGPNADMPKEDSKELWNGI